MCEPIPLDEDGRIPITELAARHRRAHEWDLEDAVREATYGARERRRRRAQRDEAER